MQGDVPAEVRMTDLLGAAFKALKVMRKKKRDALDRAQIAKAFNDRYCYVEQYEKDAERLGGTAVYGLLPRGGNRWMCPDCNRIHAPTACSVWSGLQYPACCKTGAGNRLSHGIRISA